MEIAQIRDNSSITSFGVQVVEKWAADLNIYIYVCVWIYIL